MKDKVVLITGGSSGIGKALAGRFGAAGSRVVITGRKKQALEEAAQELRNAGIDVLAINADVSVELECVNVVSRTIQQYGKIDVLINNAGISMRAMFEEIQLDVFRKVMDVNFYGMIYMTKFALPHILKSQGSVVGISSVNGRRATPARSAYSASKFAMIGFLESLRTELLHRHVHVLTVCPGFTASNIRKSALLANGSTQGASPRNESRMMSADDVADEVYHAVINRKRDLLLTLQGKLAVWLNQLFPRWMDRKTIELMAREDGSLPAQALPNDQSERSHADGSSAKSS